MLNRHPAVKTQNFHEAENFIEGSLRASILKSPAAEQAIDLEANHFMLANTEIWSCIYGVPITLEFPEGDYFRIQFHHKGQGVTRIGGHSFEVTPEQSVISSSKVQVDFGPDFQQTVLRISKASLARKIAALTGSALVRPLEFNPTFNPISPKPRILKSTLDLLVQMLNSSQDTIPDLFLSELEQTIITSFLTCCPHNYMFLLEKEPKLAAPLQVRRIEEYIEANWNKPLKIRDIKAISGCSARSIFRTFQQSRGYSPMAFAKKLRLQRAREMILNSEKSTITQIALTCGFVDLGRFSRDYGQAFGELPSQTMKHK